MKGYLVVLTKKLTWNCFRKHYAVEKITLHQAYDGTILCIQKNLIVHAAKAIFSKNDTEIPIKPFLKQLETAQEIQLGRILEQLIHTRNKITVHQIRDNYKKKKNCCDSTNQ